MDPVRLVGNIELDRDIAHWMKGTILGRYDYTAHPDEKIEVIEDVD